MVFVSERDLAAAAETAERLSSRAGSSESLMEALREHLPGLLHADLAATMNINLPVRSIDGFARTPPGPMESQDQQWVSKILRQHPIARHYASAPRLRPHLVSDFIDFKTWTSTGIFDEVYRRLGTPYQLVIPLGLSKRDGTVRLLDLTRATGDFSVRETDLACVLQGQLIALSRIAQEREPSNAGGPLTNATQLCRDLGLTPRELEVVTLLVQGRTAVAMGHALGVSPRTIEKHLERIYSKTGTHDRLAMAKLLWTGRQETSAHPLNGGDGTAR